jgi:hypothetical protein
MLMGVGFAIAAAGVLKSAAAGRRLAREAAAARTAAVEDSREPAAQAASGAGSGR